MQIKRKSPLLILFILLIISVLISFNLYKLLSSSYMYSGIYIEDIYVSGMDKNTAYDHVKRIYDKKFESAHINLISDNYKKSLFLKDISYSLYIDEAVDRAYSLGREGNTLKRIIDIIYLKNNDVVINITPSFDKKKLYEYLKNIENELFKESKNAQVTYDGKTISLIKEINGKKMNVEYNASYVNQRILNKNIDSIKLYIDSIYPPTTIKDIREIDTVLGSFKTSFNANNSNRKHNITIACDKMNNKIILPGEIFSMDEVLGPRITANGYKSAPVIIRSKLVDGIGGGICQVATTLYNTVLLSGLSIIERSHHSWPLDYVKPGLDATIAEGLTDLKFKNDLGYAVVLYSKVVDNQIDIQILGKKHDNFDSIRISTELLASYPPVHEEYKIDNSLDDGVKEISIKGRTGLKVLVYRDYINKEGDSIKRDRVSLDFYRPINPVYRVNERYYNTLKNTT